MLKMWGWDGPHHICNSATPKKEYCHSHADNDVYANPFIFLSLQAKK
jgi:hypothetical protein